MSYESLECLSDMIEHAVNDLRLCERDSRYSINMNQWHSGTKFGNDGKCEVCLGGAVIAKSLNYDIGLNTGVWAYRGRTRAILRALNLAQIGGIKGAILEFYSPFATEIASQNVAKWDEPFVLSDYAKDPDQFNYQMETYITKLWKLGL